MTAICTTAKFSSPTRRPIPSSPSARTRLEALTGNITLEALQTITLDPNVNLSLTASMLGHTVMFETTTTRITLNSNVSTGGANLVLDAGNGALTVGSLNTGVGSVVLAGAGMTFNAGTITASALSINDTATNSGIGTHANPVATSVGRLDASANAGGVFVANSGQVLNLGNFNTSINGVHATAGAVEITNNATINLTDVSDGANITAPSSILVRADGATSDVVVANGTSSINSPTGNITVQAGRDVLIGNGGTSARGVVNGPMVTLNAGHAVVIDDNSAVTADNGVIVTAGTTVAAPDARPSSITLAQTHTAGAQIGTRGGAIVSHHGARRIRRCDAHSGNVNGDLVTTLTAGHSNNIAFTTDDVNLATPINAGTGVVSFVPATTGLGIDLGTNHPAGTANYPGTLGNTSLSLTNTELNNITAASVSLGSASLLAVTDFSSFGAVTVSAPVNIAGTHFASLLIGSSQFTNNGGLTVSDLLVDSDGDILSPGALTIPDASLFLSTHGDVTLSGPVFHPRC